MANPHKKLKLYHLDSIRDNAAVQVANTHPFERIAMITSTLSRSFKSQRWQKILLENHSWKNNKLRWIRNKGIIIFKLHSCCRHIMF